MQTASGLLSDGRPWSEVEVVGRSGEEDIDELQRAGKLVDGNENGKEQRADGPITCGWLHNTVVVTMRSDRGGSRC